MLAEQSSWWGLRTEFLALGHGGWLHAIWSSVPGDDGNRWHLAGKDDVAREDFRQLAEQAAFKLGHRKASTAVSFWLDTLRRERKGCYKGGFVGEVADREGKAYIPLENGIIEDLGGVSEKYCWMLVMKDVEVAEAPATPAPAVGQPTQPESKRPDLDVNLIKSWIDDNGWTNETLAQRLDLSERAVSSMRNNRDYHGADAIIKLANLMQREPEDHCLTSPEAST